MKSLFVISLLLITIGVQGWGELGHKIVAQIAWNELKESTRYIVSKLLGKRLIVYHH